MAFPNSPSCGRFKDFISRTILERVSNGSLLVWGEAGKVNPPHLVMPITVEPNTPRMCHDERFLNCWIKDCPFTLDYITDLPRYVLPGHFQTSFDDNSGYDHVRLHPSSSTVFGLQWKGWFFVFTTIPFGWKASAFVYHSIGMAATVYIRSLNTISNRKAKQLNKPWITRGLRISIKKKSELFFSGNKSKYKIYRNKILTLSRLSKKLYYHDYFMTNSNNIKRTWDGINMLINRKRKSENSITALKRPGNRGISYHTFELPSILNNHFASVGPNLASKIPQSQIHFSNYLSKPSTLGSFAFQPVTASEVELEILSTPHNKAYGLFSCPIPLLKCASKPFRSLCVKL